MAITAMGLGTKGAPANTNLDPQNQFWSWLYAFKNEQQIGTTTYRNGLFAGFTITQNDPGGMSILIGADDPVNSAVLEYATGKMALLSTDGTPQTVTIPTAPASGSRIDSIVSYIDVSSPNPDSETPGTPEYVKTVVVSGTAASSPTAPTKQQIQAALPSTVENWYHWADVKVAASQTVITNSNITDRKPTSPNLYWTTSDFNNAANSRINALVPNMIVQRAPYVASVSVNASATTTPTITAPAAKSGFKFLCWVMLATSGFVGAFYPENPTSRTTKCFGVVTGGGSGKLNAYALYIPTS